MFGRSACLRASALILLVTLTACQTARIGEAQSSSAPSRSSADKPILPANFRKDIAPLLVSNYVKDGIGPATISEVITSHGLIGENASFAIRYPAKVSNFVFNPDLVLTRCIKVLAVRSSGTTDSVRYTMDKDAGSCSNYVKAEPYVELEQMAAKLRACKAKGEERCLLSTNMPEAQARKLMYQN